MKPRRRCTRLYHVVPSRRRAISDSTNEMGEPSYLCTRWHVRMFRAVLNHRCNVLLLRQAKLAVVVLSPCISNAIVVSKRGIKLQEGWRYFNSRGPHWDVGSETGNQTECHLPSARLVTLLGIQLFRSAIGTQSHHGADILYGINLFKSRPFEKTQSC